MKCNRVTVPNLIFFSDSWGKALARFLTSLRSPWSIPWNSRLRCESSVDQNPQGSGRTRGVKGVGKPLKNVFFLNGPPSFFFLFLTVSPKGTFPDSATTFRRYGNESCNLNPIGVYVWVLVLLEIQGMSWYNIDPTQIPPVFLLFAAPSIDTHLKISQS